MSDNDKNKSVQRFSRRNRKNSLTVSGALFPPEDDDVNVTETASEVVQADIVPASEYQAPELDLDALAALDSDDEALAALSNLSRDEVRAPIIAPQAERYPPINPARMVETEVAQPSVADLAAAQAKRRRAFRNNMITLFSWLAMIGTIAWTAIIWMNPQSIYNPLPPQTPFTIVTATSGASVENPAMPTANAEGQIFVVATDSATATSIPTDSPYPFIVPDAALYVPNGNDLACNWWSIAGTVTTNNGEPINGYRVRVIGNGINETVFSGTTQTFGAGGFELPLVGTPQIAEFSIQLFSPQDAPLSQPISVTTRADCDGNVAIVNFVQNR